MNNFERMEATNKAEINDGIVVNKSAYELKCVKIIGSFKIFVDHFMSLKYYYVLRTDTQEIRYAGLNRLQYIKDELQEDVDASFNKN